MKIEILDEINKNRKQIIDKIIISSEEEYEKEKVLTKSKIIDFFENGTRFRSHLIKIISGFGGKVSGISRKMKQTYLIEIMKIIKNSGEDLTIHTTKNILKKYSGQSIKEEKLVKIFGTHNRTSSEKSNLDIVNFEELEEIFQLDFSKLKLHKNKIIDEVIPLEYKEKYLEIKKTLQKINNQNDLNKDISFF